MDPRAVQRFSNISNTQQTAPGARVAVRHPRVLSLYHPSLQCLPSGFSRILGLLQLLLVYKGP